MRIVRPVKPTPPPSISPVGALFGYVFGIITMYEIREYSADLANEKREKIKQLNAEIS